MAPAAFCYFLLRSAIESPAQLRGVTYVLVGLTLFQAVNGIVQFHTGSGIGGVVALEDHSLLTDGADEDEVRRIRGTGIFNDPNDLAMTLVIAVPFVAGPLFRRGIPRRVLALAMLALVPIVTALYYTNSRGGMLGLAAAVLPYGYRRFGRLAGTVAGAAGLVLLIALGPSRMAGLDASESSAQGRIQAWAEGLQMFKSQPLFGVGFGALTPTSIASSRTTRSSTRWASSACSERLRSWAWGTGSSSAAAGASSRAPKGGERICGRAGWRSRSARCSCRDRYSVVLFVWLALSAGYLHLMAAAPQRSPRPAVHLARIAAITAGGVICTYVAVRLFGQFSV